MVIVFAFLNFALSHIEADSPLPRRLCYRYRSFLFFLIHSLFYGRLSYLHFCPPRIELQVFRHLRRGRHFLSFCLRRIPAGELITAADYLRECFQLCFFLYTLYDHASLTAIWIKVHLVCVFGLGLACGWLACRWLTCRCIL